MVLYDETLDFIISKFSCWPFAVLRKQTTLFTPNDGIMQHSEQTSISQSFYPNLESPDGRKHLFSRGLSRELCAMGHYRSAVFIETRLSLYFVKQRVLNC